MERWDVVRHQVAIAGRITDQRTGKPLPGARVTITGPPAFTARLALQAQQYGDRWERMSERPDRTRAAADGHFHFLDLPAGPYTLTAVLPDAGSRYGPRTIAVEVARAEGGELALVAADLALPSTSVTGRIVQSDDAAVAMAEVRIRGSGERTFSRGDGKYLLSALETGTRTLLASARGYQQATQIVELGEAGEVRTVNVTLQPNA